MVAFLQELPGLAPERYAALRRRAAAEETGSEEAAGASEEAQEHGSHEHGP